MTGPVTDPPPSGPGRDAGDFDDSDLYLATVGCEVVDPLEAWAESIAAAAPPLTAAQRSLVAGVFAGVTR